MNWICKCGARWSGSRDDHQSELSGHTAEIDHSVPPPAVASVEVVESPPAEKPTRRRKAE
jgi:hypothetical protein